MKARRFFAFVAAAGMLFAVGCTPDEGVEADEEQCAISLDPTSFATSLEGGEQVVTVTSNGAWVATCDQADVTIEPISGNGNGVVTITVPAVETARNFKVVFDAAKQTYVPELGQEMTTTADAEVTVAQNATGTDMSDFIYYEKCGEDVEKDGNYWPYVDKFEGWSREGEGQSGVVYSGKNASVRASGVNYQPTEDATGLTGQPYVFLNKVPAEAYFVIENIAVAGGKNYIFNYNVSCQNGYSGAPTFAEVDNTLVHLELGYDGESWDAVDCTFAPNGGNGWYAATAEFKVAADATTLYVRVSYEQGGGSTSNTGARFDDFKVVEGGNGVELDPVLPVPVEATLDQITTVGYYSVKSAWAVATYARGALLTDASGAYLLAYQPSETPAVGEVVDIVGNVSTSGGLLQFGEGATITKTGETKTVTNPTPVVLDGAAADALIGDIEIKYVQYEGTLAISGYYYNVTIAGASTAIGSISYPLDDMNETLSALNGKAIKVTGYAVGVSSSKYLNTMATSVEEVEGGDTPDTPDTPTVKTLPYEETFASTQGDFTINNVSLGGLEGEVWVHSASYGNISASAYVEGTKYATESWLVSPQISLSGATAPELTFDHTHRYAGTLEEELTLWVSEDNGANWTQVTIPTYGSNNDYNYVTPVVDLTSYVGKTINVGFKYVSTTSNAGTWRIKNFKVAEKGAAVEPEPEPEPEQPIVGGKEVTVAYDQASGNAETSITKTVDGITIVIDKNTASNNPNEYKDGTHVRVMGGNTITITGGTIKKVVMTCTSANYVKTFSANTGAVKNTENIIEWTGETTELVLTNTETAQARVKTIKVIYTE